MVKKNVVVRNPFCIFCSLFFSEFSRLQGNYLGHVIKDDGVKLDPKKIECLVYYFITVNEKYKNY